jgi:hypothetical protein
MAEMFGRLRGDGQGGRSFDSASQEREAALALRMTILGGRGATRRVSKDCSAPMPTGPPSQSDSAYPPAIPVPADFASWLWPAGSPHAPP